MAVEAPPIAETPTFAVIDEAPRDALVATIREIAPEGEAREVLIDASHDLLKTARLAGSRSPFDHVRMAISKAASSTKRRDTIESLARGIMRNWAKESFPAIVAPAAPGLAQPRLDLEAERRIAVEKRRAAETANADHDALKARWESLPLAAKDSAHAEFERAEARPSDRVLVKLWELRRQEWCLKRLASQP